MNPNQFNISTGTYDDNEDIQPEEVQPNIVPEINQKPTKRNDLFLPIRKAQEKGATPSQILTGISSRYPDYAEKIETARSQGASDDQIFKAISDRPGATEAPIRKAGRLLTQGAIGISEAMTMPYNLTATGLKAIATSSLRPELEEDMRQLEKMNGSGIWSDKDAEYYDYLKNLTEDPDRLDKIKGEMPSFDVGSLIEYGFESGNIDIQPEDLSEEAARWIGFIKDPKKLYSAAKETYKNPKEAAKLVKAVMPTLEETARGFGAATGMDIAKEGGFGPVGSIAATIVGDLVGGKAANITTDVAKGAAKGATNYANNPSKYHKLAKQKTANVIAKMAKTSGSEVSKSIAESMERSGVEADLGSLTDSNVVKVVQTALEQSGLVGDDLDMLRSRITEQVQNKYNTILDDIGKFKFETIDDAGDAVRNATKKAGLPFYTGPMKASKEVQESFAKRVSKEPIPEYVDDFLWNVSKKPTESTRAVGQNIKESANRSRDLIKKDFSKEYESIKGEIGSITSTQEALAKDIKKFIKENEGSLLKDASPAEKKVIDSTKSLYNELVDGTPKIKGKMSGFEDIIAKQKSILGENYKPVTIDSMWKTKTTLGELADFEFGKSNFRTKFRKLYGRVNEAIQETLDRKAPEYADDLRKLDKKYSEFKDNFENSHVESLFRKGNKDYSKIYNSFLDNDAITRLEPILSETKTGIRLNNQVHRDFASKTLNKKNLTLTDINDLQNSIGYSSQLKQKIRENSFDKLKKGFNEAKKGVQPKKIKTPVTEAMKPTTKEVGNRKLPSERVSREAKINTLVEKQYQQNLDTLIKKKNPTQIFNMTNSVDGIKSLERLLDKTPEGKEIVDGLKRLKFEKMIGENMTDSVTKQLKTGTFSKLLEKGNNREIAQHILGKEGYKDFVYLQDHSSQLSKSAQKFFNSSKTATTMRDISKVSSVLIGFATGNWWLPASVLGSMTSGKVVAKFISDPEFLGMVKDAILANENNDVKLLDSAWREILTKVNEEAPELMKSTGRATVKNL